MSSEINKIRNFGGASRIRPGERTTGVEDLPLDHRLSFSSAPDEKWTFEENHVLFNGHDVNELINESGNDIRYLSGLSAGIDQYRKHVWERGGRSEGKFNGTANALLEKILGKLGSIYDGLFMGLRFEYTGGEDFWINDVNLKAVLNLYRLRPTMEARCYLIGLRNKLGLIIGAQNGSARYDGVKQMAEELFGEISCALDSIAPDDMDRALPPHRPS